MQARLVMAETGNGLRRNPSMTFAVIATVTISLALLGVGLLMRAQVGAMKDYWYDKVEVSVFLDRAVTDPERARIEQVLTTDPAVQQVFHETPQEAFVRFSRQFRDSPELARNITADALSESYRVKLVDPTNFAKVQALVGTEPGVGQVVDQRRLLEKFFTLLNGLEAATLLFALTQVVAAAILIANTVRLAVHSRRREVEVMRLVGASTFLIRLPFLLTAGFSGMVGAAAASGLLVAVKHFFIDDRLRKAFPVTAFVGWSQVYQAMALLAVLGAVLPVAAAAVSLRRHLRV